MPDRRKNNLDERVASIETAINGQGGILDRLKHLDKCLDGLKKTVWVATGFLTAVIAFANWVSTRV